MKFHTVISYVLFSLLSPHYAEENPSSIQLKAKEPSLKLANIFANDMVIQRDTNAAIWGNATPRSTVAIKPSWQKDTVTTKADNDGRWKAIIPTPEAGGPHTINVKSGELVIQLKNVLSGEVWICSGQSNMQWKLRGFGPTHFKEDVDKANYPNIRLCEVSKIMALTKQNDTKVQWNVCSPRKAINFSAVAYFFGARIHQELDVPIGLISTNWGGSAIEGWMSQEVLEKELPKTKEQTKHYTTWVDKYGSSIIVNNKKTKKPKGVNQSSPSVLYNTMIHPLIPFSFRGVIWYQGEANVSRPAEYTSLFPAMIADWRSRWAIGDFPFYYVQIAPFHYNSKDLPSSLLREAQLKTLTVPKTGMVVTMDIGSVDDIHPKAKKPVGERLALLALARNYGKNGLVDSGPLYKSYKVEGDTIRILFESIGSGLATLDGRELTHFTIAGIDQKFVAAKATIEGDSLIVHSDKIIKPIAVRFGWGDSDITNFANKEKLPASSFRTDNWVIEPKVKDKKRKGE